MKKTVKFTALAIAVAAIATAAVSCKKIEETPKDSAPSVSEKTPETQKSIDAEELAAKILAEGKFEGALEKIDPAAIEAVYPDLPEGTKFAVYLPGVTCADEIAVFTDGDVEAIKTAVEAHIEEQRAGFASYMPEQVPKIDDRLVMTVNGAVVLVISNDTSAAKAIVENYVG